MLTRKIKDIRKSCAFFVFRSYRSIQWASDLSFSPISKSHGLYFWPYSKDRNHKCWNRFLFVYVLHGSLSRILKHWVKKYINVFIIHINHKNTILHTLPKFNHLIDYRCVFVCFHWRVKREKKCKVIASHDPKAEQLSPLYNCFVWRILLFWFPNPKQSFYIRAREKREQKKE